MNNESIHLPRILSLGIRRPGQSLFVLVLISVLALLGALRVQTDTSLARMIRQDGIERQAYLHVAREFGSDQRSFVYVRDDALWTPGKLAALEQLHDELRRLPFVERIDDLFTLPTVIGIDGQFYAQPLLPAAPSDEAAASRSRKLALESPLAARNVVSADGKAVAIGIAIREKFVGSDVEGVGGRLDAVLNPARSQFATVLHIGPSPVEAAMQQGLQTDLKLLLPAAGLSAALVVAMLCGSFGAALLALAVGALTFLWTLGMMGFAGIPLTLMTATLPVMSLVLVTIKMIRMSYRAAPDGASAGQINDQPGAGQLREFMAGNFGVPFLATVLAMTLGFSLNVFTEIQPIREFGLVVAFSTLASGVVSILLIPALYARYGDRRIRFRRSAAVDFVAQLASRAIGKLRHRATAWTVVLAAILGSGLIQQTGELRISTEPLGFFRTNHPLLETADRMHRDLAGANVFYITLDANSTGAFRDPANLKRIADIQAFIAKQPVFDRSFSLADLIALANQEATGGRSDAYGVPPSRKLVGQYLMLYPPQVLEPFVSHDMRRANIVVRHNIRESSQLNEHIHELQQAVSSYAGPTMVTAVVGENLLINAPAERLLTDLAKVSAAILILVFLGVALTYTSIKGGIIALMPSVLPMVIILGGMRLFEIPVNTTTILIAVIIMSVSIDGTLHLFSRYSELCRSTHDYRNAVVETLNSEAAPMTAICLALAVIFGTLALSDFALIAQFGALAAAAMAVALFANLLVTPLVMSRIRLVGLYEILAMSMDRDTLAASPLFRGMSNYQIRKTILISELCKFQDGQCLIEQGTEGRSMYLVISGQLEVVRRDDGRSRRQALLGPGDVFGEIGFVNSTYRTADVRALGDVSTLRFDYDRLENDLLLFPRIMAKLNFNISGILGRRLAEVVEESQATRASATASPTSPPRAT
jgi:predicted RND superfamily exporter protein